MKFSWCRNFVSTGDEVNPYTSNQWEGPKGTHAAKKFVPTGDESNSFTSTEWERAFVKAMDKNILKNDFVLMRITVREQKMVPHWGTISEEDRF